MLWLKPCVEIEKLLMEDVSPGDKEKTHLEQDKSDVSELMARNQFCVTCGVELNGEQRKFPSCEHCGAFLVCCQICFLFL